MSSESSEIAALARRVRTMNRLVEAAPEALSDGDLAELRAAARRILRYLGEAPDVRPAAHTRRSAPPGARRDRSCPSGWAAYGVCLPLVRKAAWHEEEHPRGQPGNAGQFAEKPGGRGGGRANHPGGDRRARPGLPPKWVGRVSRFRNVARRRRVLAALRSEAELAEAVDGYNLEDSLPADVMVAVGPGGELLQSKEAVHAFLKTRAEAVARLKADPHGPFAVEYRRVAEAPMALVEVKTLLTAARGEVHMSAKALRRKRAWEAKYNARFVLAVKDARKGRKHSGHSWHYLPSLKPTTRLEEMERVDFGTIYSRLLEGQV
jgi:hypothetical protein